MPCSGCSPLHGVNSKFKKEGQLSLARLSKIIDWVYFVYFWLNVSINIVYIFTMCKSQGACAEVLTEFIPDFQRSVGV